MVNRVILHIGVPKTGTSSLQKAFLENADLLRQHGIAYPLAAGNQKRGHHSLGQAIVRGEAADVAALWQALEAEMESCHTLLLSAESMAAAREPAITSFKALLDVQLGRPEFTIYVGIRRWPDRLVSVWNSRIRSGRTMGLPRFVEEQCAASPRGHFLDFTRPIEKWARVFGRAAMRVRAMERITTGGRDLVTETFRDLLAIDAAELKGRYRANESVPAQTEAIRAVNCQNRDVDGDASRRVAHTALRLFRKQRQVALDCAAALEGPLAELAIDDRHPLFVALEENAVALCGDLIERDEAGRMFPPREPRTWRYLPDEALADPWIAKKVETLHAEALRVAQKGASKRMRKSEAKLGEAW
jgi:hypothetical protein